MCFNKAVVPEISFRGFRHRGRSNRHGWGIAYYPDGKAVQVVKEPVEAGKSKLAGFLKDYRITSRIFIAHVRYASRGRVSFSNTHPFVRELNGREYVFAHNGTLNGNFAFKRFHPVGETDSESAFAYLMDCLAEKGVGQWNEENFIWLKNKLEEINRTGTLNCLFSDGEYLFAYADKDAGSLFFTRRKSPYGEIQLKDEDWRINLAEVKQPDEEGYIVATQPLTSERWDAFTGGELMVFRNGEMVFASHHELISDNRSLTANEVLVLEVIRNAPHRLSHSAIKQKLADRMSSDSVTSSIRVLLDMGYIMQDRRDRVKWDSDSATFYTVSDTRNEIDRILRSRK